MHLQYIHVDNAPLVAVCNDLCQHNVRLFSCALPYVSAIKLIYQGQGPSQQPQLKTLLWDAATVCSWREQTLVCWCNLLKGRKTLYSSCWMSPGRPQPQRKLGTGGWRIRVFFLSLWLYFSPFFPHTFSLFPLFVEGTKSAPGLAL